MIRVRVRVVVGAKVGVRVSGGALPRPIGVCIPTKDGAKKTVLFESMTGATVGCIQIERNRDNQKAVRLASTEAQQTGSASRVGQSAYQQTD